MNVLMQMCFINDRNIHFVLTIAFSIAMILLKKKRFLHKSNIGTDYIHISIDAVIGENFESGGV